MRCLSLDKKTPEKYCYICILRILLKKIRRINSKHCQDVKRKNTLLSCVEVGSGGGVELCESVSNENRGQNEFEKWGEDTFVAQAKTFGVVPGTLTTGSKGSYPRKLSGFSLFSS